MIVWIFVILGVLALEMVCIHLLSVVLPGNSDGSNPLIDDIILYQQFVAYPVLDFVQAFTITLVIYLQTREKDQSNLSDRGV